MEDYWSAGRRALGMDRRRAVHCAKEAQALQILTSLMLCQKGPDQTRQLFSIPSELGRRFKGKPESSHVLDATWHWHQGEPTKDRV